MAFYWIWLLVLVVLVGCGCGDPVCCNPAVSGSNVAQGKPAWQSSTWTQEGANLGLAGNAVDGKRDGNFHQGSCSVTQRNMGPWWIVDLQKNHTINAVVVSNRQDCCAERLKGAEIHVGNSVADHGKSNPICGTISDINSASITICCPNLKGRFVSVIIPDRAEYLQLCEVEVQGTEDPECQCKG